MTVRGRLATGLVLAWALGSSALWVLGLPEYWEAVTGDDSAMTWLQLVVLVAAAVIAAIVAWATHRSGQQGTRVWCVLTVAYGGLALDERFAVHDRLRAGRLPQGAREQLVPWVGPGEALLLLVAAAGLAALPLVWRAVREDTWARTALAIGVALAVVTVGLDSIDPTVWTPAQSRLETGVEEVVELGGGVALLGSALLRLVTLVEGLVPSRGAPAPVSDVVAPTA